MLQQYAWAIGISVLVNSNMSVGAPCPTSVTRSARGIAVRFKKTKAGMIQCHRILRKLDPEGGRDLVLRTAEYHRVRRELNSLPLRQSWFDHGGYFARNGSAYWGWAWEDDPYGVLFTTRPIFRRSVIPLVASSGTCPKHAIAVHMRCSDIPFCRGTYTLMRHSWFKSALDKAPPSAYKNGKLEICVFMCTHHQSAACTMADPKANMSARAENCMGWATALVEDLQADPRVGSVTHICGNVENDFGSMVYSPLLISGGSSLSFVAALLRTPDAPSVLPLPISAGYWTQQAGKNSTAVPDPASGIHILSAPRVMHSEIESYYDAKAVLRVLRS
eukprot:Hpha_TRINITY_DN15276_c0_g1::TRINITY_DN15276_c0_g1_i3::g.66482::m.66482